ncbi:helix-turn-helix domain-containing protein [Ferrovum sp.]|uniref:helix-turn-helix transcriptional regulator n=1 Tax=Ferrovum sp. TaxID=2609467 RepID=UPI00342BA38C
MERNFSTLPSETNLSVKEVKLLTGLGIATIWRRVKAGEIPAPKRFGSRTFWKLGEILEWLNTAGV